jgi:hypothetical protein
MPWPRHVVVEPLALIKIRDLDFGRIAAQPTAGTVTVDPNTGACTATGGVISVGNCGYAEFSADRACGGCGCALPCRPRSL